jgi:RNA recognition motif-containing protein
MTIYIGNLNATTCEAQIKELFQAFGEVLDVIIMMDKETNQSRQYGYVLMDNKILGDEAIARLNNMNFMNKYIEVFEVTYDAFGRKHG